MRRHISTCTSSDSDTSGDDQVVSPQRYAALQLQQGLENWTTRRRAMQELTTITHNVYKAHATKATQAAIFADILRAIQLCDRRVACRQAVEDLVRAAKRVLPQKKWQQVQGEHSRASMASKRAERRQQTGRVEEEGDGQADGVEPLFDLPLPTAVVEVVLGLVDPVTRARAACVCRSWKVLVEDARVWDAWGSVLYPKQAKAGTPFAALVAADPRPILRFRACRAQLGRQCAPVWWDCTAECAVGSAQGSGSAASTPAARPYFLSVAEVLAWLLGKSVGRGRHSGGGSSDSSSGSGSQSDEAAGHETVRRLRMWALPAVGHGPVLGEDCRGANGDSTGNPS